jgi:hypothetical protein
VWHNLLLLWLASAALACSFPYWPRTLRRAGEYRAQFILLHMMLWQSAMLTALGRNLRRFVAFGTVSRKRKPARLLRNCVVGLPIPTKSLSAGSSSTRLRYTTVAEMRPEMLVGDAKSHPAKVWVYILLFFGVGAAIGLAVALYSIRLGTSVRTAIFIGSGAGGFGAWLVFAVFIKAYRAIRRSGGQ